MHPPSVITRIHSGLGNQMFQYAAGRALSLRLGVPLLLDIGWFADHGGARPRAYGLGAFDLDAVVVGPEVAVGVPKIIEPYRHYWHGLEEVTAAPVAIQGYWQSPRHFGRWRDIIRADFAFPPLPSDAGRAVAAHIAATPNAVAVHIRRGDYVADRGTRERWGGICTPAYYAAAFNLLATRYGRRTLFLFSDDPAWLKANFHVPFHETVVVDVPEHAAAPVHDMHLMSLARHHVIANSTFSWWGAWLAVALDPVVISPGRWTNDSPAETGYGMRDRLPSSWIRL